MMNDPDDDDGDPTSRSYAAALLRPNTEDLLNTKDNFILLQSKRNRRNNNKNLRHSGTPDMTVTDTTHNTLPPLSSLQASAKRQPAPSHTSKSAAYLSKLSTQRAVPLSLTKKPAPPPTTSTANDSPSETSTATQSSPAITITTPIQQKQQSIPLSEASTQQWLIIEIPKPEKNENHVAESVIDIITKGSHYDSKLQILPMVPINPYTKPDGPTLLPLTHGRIPKPFTDFHADKYVAAKPYFTTRDITINGAKAAITYIHFEIQIETFASPYDFANAMETLYLTHSPRSKVALHPLNSQLYSDLGYLQNSSLQVNLDDLQSKIAQATGTPVYLKLDHLR